MGGEQQSSQGNGRTQNSMQAALMDAWLDTALPSGQSHPGCRFPLVLPPCLHLPPQAPEVLRGERATPASDVYSFGMVSLVGCRCVQRLAH